MYWYTWCRARWDDGVEADIIIRSAADKSLTVYHITDTVEEAERMFEERKDKGFEVIDVYEEDSALRMFPLEGKVLTEISAEYED